MPSLRHWLNPGRGHPPYFFLFLNGTRDKIGSAPPAWNFIQRCAGRLITSGIDQGLAEPEARRGISNRSSAVPSSARREAATGNVKRTPSRRGFFPRPRAPDRRNGAAAFPLDRFERVYVIRKNARRVTRATQPREPRFPLPSLGSARLGSAVAFYWVRSFIWKSGSRVSPPTRRRAR